MALTTELLNANAALSGLTDEQKNAIVEMSKNDETAVIGDRIYTDIKSGLNAGTVTILVMSGETTKEILDESPDKPQFVMESAKEILESLKK